jgi:hypothetical protein
VYLDNTWVKKIFIISLFLFFSKIKYMKYILIIIFMTTFSNLGFAQSDNTESVEAISSEEDFELRKVKRLKRIRIDLIRLNSEINILKESLRNEFDVVSKMPGEIKLYKLEKKFKKLKFRFIETATNINLSVESKIKKKTDIMEDLKQILEPAINAVKEISEKPRQIQELKEKTGEVEGRYNDALSAKTQIEKMFKEGNEKILNPRYKASISTLNTLIKTLKLQLDDLEYKVIKSKQNEKSIVSTFSGLIFDFFKTKGKNLALAFVVFIGFFWSFKTGQNKFLAIAMFRANKSRKSELYQWMIRPIRVIYNAVTTIMSFFFAILTLYVLNDWVLVTFILFVLAALIWSSKQYLPIFLEQSKIVLNLGAIRENERLVYNGLPWIIKSLGYYCRLSNPVLSGGDLRVNTRELLNSNSRRVIFDEPWFPTQLNDWIEVNEEFGQVVMQSPEQVIIKKVGGEQKFFQTSEFYSMSPVNLSLGFSIEFNFGVDYSHQAELFETVIPSLSEDLKMEVYNTHADIKESFKSLSVEFINAGASSLDLRFFLACDGKIAGNKMMLTRSVQAHFVKLCNKYDYIIPFNQLTVHMNNGK